MDLTVSELQDARKELESDLEEEVHRLISSFRKRCRVPIESIRVDVESIRDETGEKVDTVLRGVSVELDV
jgi:hypothetical protein